jgi:sigma-B regulation protein RsbU (phosphoserine phosphatase)
MPRVREAYQLLGISGTAFLIALACYFAFYFAGNGPLTLLAVLVLIPLGAILVFRTLRFIKNHALWSVRNRLLCVYGLMGALPILLLFVLFGLGAWALMNELAIYLASSALDRNIESVQKAVEIVRKMPPEFRHNGAPEVARAFGQTFPGFRFYIKDENGEHRYPADAPPLTIPPGWGDVNGLLVLDRHFYGWAHYANGNTEITALAPFSNEMIENLVPHLGVIALFEEREGRQPNWPPASAGSLRIKPTRMGNNPDFQFAFNNDSQPASSGRRESRLPPPMSRFDIPVFWPSTFPHYHLDTPGRTYSGALWVYSRPSAVLRTFFSQAEILRGVLYDLVIGVAILFLIVELVAVGIGIALSRRITRAVNQLYEGTRRVIRGDFQHRIQVQSHDQLGELTDSFNQMTGTLERLMAVEKEKERLQTELEIAREVQSQLYPKAAPPFHGLKLTVRCDPARMVSGDYYDYQEVARNKLAFAIGDVAGKGISAALLMATLQAALRAQIAQYQPVRENECTDTPELDAARLVAQLNKQIYAHTSPEKYATFFFGLFDERNRALTYTNAGHLSPLLFRNGDVLPLDSNGTVVGAFPWSQYDESCLVMQPGDLLVCYTDGITEPENAYGEMFGEDRLIDLIHKHHHEEDHHIIDIVLDAVRSWTGTPELHDDMTLLLAREVQAA